MKKVSAQRRRFVNYGTAAVIVACIVLAVAWNYATSPSLREPACAAGEAAMFNDGWWCVQARKP